MNNRIDSARTELAMLEQRCRRVEFDALKIRYRETKRGLRNSRDPNTLAALWESYTRLTDLAHRFFNGEALADDEDA
jgi:hypothetical protein